MELVRSQAIVHRYESLQLKREYEDSKIFTTFKKNALKVLRGSFLQFSVKMLL